MMDQSELEALAGSIADRIRPGSRLFLTGDLGTGKSVFARAVLRKLGVEGVIPSPSFIVDAVYSTSGLEIHHIDLYRLDGSLDELEFYGILEVLESDAAAIVEWAERLDESVLSKGILISISFTDDPSKREVLIDDRDLAGD
jgi:tRNA threonylcarbamoyladenosine biosynthesis protein TsaE